MSLIMPAMFKTCQTSQTNLIFIMLLIYIIYNSAVYRMLYNLQKVARATECYIGLWNANGWQQVILPITVIKAVLQLRLSMCNDQSLHKTGTPRGLNFANNNMSYKSWKSM